MKDRWLVGTLASMVFVIGCGAQSSSTVEISSAPDAGSVRPSRDASVVDAGDAQSSGMLPDDAAVTVGDACEAGPAALDAVDLDASRQTDASATVACIRCIAAACDAEFRQCMNDCECNLLAAEMLRCMQGGGPILACGGPARASTNASTQAVVTCISGQIQCASVCGI